MIMNTRHKEIEDQPRLNHFYLKSTYTPFNIPPPDLKRDLRKRGLEDMCLLVIKLRGEARREVNVKARQQLRFRQHWGLASGVVGNSATLCWYS